MAKRHAKVIRLKDPHEPTEKRTCHICPYETYFTPQKFKVASSNIAMK